MTLLALMYHRARAGVYGNSPQMLDAHFAHIADHFACVLPGEPLDHHRLNVCITFDDAYFDFYAVAYPLLEKRGLRALLAVAPAAVREQAVGSASDRLDDDAVLHDNTSSDGCCTWTELRELAATGRVAFAAHGFTHQPLDRAGLDLNLEITVSQAMIAARTGAPVRSFVFPYGRFSRDALQRVSVAYDHAFRIGSADNGGWGHRLTYRISADNLPSPVAPFARSRLLKYRAQRYWNQLRRR